ncbi:actin-bundling T4SS effector WalE1 family protein [Wolbachia endosymbiont of Trichogramma kaykai]|uniref:actin-bundling T4SS effector WalE1 family protein n=1 Tax=Wolbachia endosymbiont of Trichogramma kaykai TaxID=444066 RepID=UPI0038926556
MSPSEIKSNSRPVEAQQDNLGVSTITQDSLSADIVHDSKKLKERITDLLKGDTEFSKMKQGDQVLVVGTASGLFAAMLPLLAVGATLAIPSAIVGLTLFYAAKVAVKAVQSGYKGLKYSSEKTVEGAKHIGGKIKDGYEYSANSLKRGASFISEKTKEKTSNVLTTTANKLYRAAGNENYSDKIDNELIPDSPQKKRIQEVKEDLRAICTDGKNNSMLIKSILSGILEKIGGKKETYRDQGDHLPDQLVDKWREQKKFINNLDADGLCNLVTKRLSDKDKYFRDSIFSEHYDEIKEVIKECKKEHTHFNTLQRLNESAKWHKAIPAHPKAIPTDSLENSLSDSSSMSSVSTVSSQAELLNPNEHKEVKEPTSLWSKLSSSLKGGKKPEEATYVRHLDSELDQIQPAEIGKRRFYVAPEKPSRSNSMGSLSTDGTATTSSFASYHRNPDSGFNSPGSSPQHGMFTEKNGKLYVAPEKPSRSNSMGSLGTDSTATTSSFASYHRNPDNGFNSPSSSPQHGMFTEKNGKLKVQADLRKTGSLEKLVGPSSTVTAEVDVEHRAPKMKV